MQKLQGFLQLCLASPLTAQEIDVRELLEQVWNAGEVGRESPVLDEKTSAERKAQAQGAGQIPPQIEQALQKQEQLIQQLEEKLRDREEALQVKLSELQIKDRDSRVDAEVKLAGVEMSEAQRDKLQAEVLAIVTEVLGRMAVPPATVSAAAALDDPSADTETGEMGAPA